jgi:hypothetical protein
METDAYLASWRSCEMRTRRRDGRRVGRGQSRSRRRAQDLGKSTACEDGATYLGLNGDSLGVNGGQVGVLEERDEVSLGRLLEGSDRRRLESKVGLEVPVG